MTDRPNPDHLKAWFSAELPPEGLPRCFGIVTAFDPDSRPAPLEENARADAALKRHLEDAGLPHFRATGGARDGSHREPGYGIAARSPENIRPISRLFRQEAFFWVEDGMISVINTEGASRHPVARWEERQIDGK